MITLTIDGQKVQVEEGKSILEAAQEADIFIPTFCNHPKLETIGACRICLVEIEGGRRPEASCAIKAAPDMVVHTYTPTVLKARKINLEALLADHPLDCPHCESGGDCDLQKVTYYFGGVDNRLAGIFGPQESGYKIKYYSPIIERDTEKCIHCKRCVRTCREIQGVHALGLVNRGHHTFISPYYEHSLDCEFCGRCVTLCPVGALINKKAKHKARPWEVKMIKSVCPYCGNGCRFDYWVKDGKLIKVVPQEDEGMNQGNLCIRGYFGYDLLQDEERISKPVIKDNKKQVSVDLSEAIDKTASIFRQIMNKELGSQVAIVTAGRLSVEEHYLFQKLFRLMFKTNNFYTLNNLLNHEKISKIESILGNSASTVAYQNLENADTILILNSDITENNPTVGNIIKKIYSQGKSEIINFNDKEVNIDKFSNNHFELSPEKTASILRMITAQLYQGNKEEINSQITDKPKVRLILDQLTKEKIGTVSSKTGLSQKDIKNLNKKIKESEKLIIVASLAELSPDLAEALSLMLFCGGFHLKDGSGLALLRSRNNDQGADEMGFQPNYLPGKQEISNFKVAKKFENQWHSSLNPEEGFSIDDFLQRLDKGRIPLLIYLGGEPPYSHQPISEFKKIFFKKKIEKFSEDVVRFWEKMSQAGFLIIFDAFNNFLTKKADVFLPISTPAEKDGAYINGERRIQFCNRAIKPRNGLKTDWQIIEMLGETFNQILEYSNVYAIDKEIKEVVPQFKGFSYHQKMDFVNRSLPVEQIEFFTFESEVGERIII